MKTEGEYVDEDRITDRLLTDEDEPMVKLKAELRSGSYHGEERKPQGQEDCSDCEQRIAQETLKAVGEWLVEFCEVKVNHHNYDGLKWMCAECLKDLFFQLKQGKMPDGH